MATITLDLSEEMERRLANLAKAQGRRVDGVVSDILNKALYDPVTTTNPNDLPYEVWHERFQAWVKNIPQVNVEFVDDSRESIYEGR